MDWHPPAGGGGRGPGSWFWAPGACVRSVGEAPGRRVHFGVLVLELEAEAEATQGERAPPCRRGQVTTRKRHPAGAKGAPAGDQGGGSKMFRDFSENSTVVCLGCGGSVEGRASFRTPGGEGRRVAAPCRSAVAGMGVLVFSLRREEVGSAPDSLGDSAEAPVAGRRGNATPEGAWCPGGLGELCRRGQQPQHLLSVRAEW